VPELRLLFPNGSLVFPPFPNERYRHDVHAALYRCKLKSALGTVVSREVHVKAGESHENIFVVGTARQEIQSRRHPFTGDNIYRKSA
jgi:hypothetical protein